MWIKKRARCVLFALGIGMSSMASADNIYPVKIEQAQHIKTIINGDNSNNSVGVKPIDLPSFNSGDGTFDTFVGGFKFVDTDTLTQLGNEILNNDLKHYARYVYAAKQAFEKAITNPTIENVTEFKQYQKTLAYASKLNLGQLRAYAQGILDYQVQNPSDQSESKALASFAQGVIDYYNLFFKVALDKPLTEREKVIANRADYPIVSLANAFSKDIVSQSDQVKSDDGIYKGLADNSCNYGVGCNEIVNKAHGLYASQTMSGDYDIAVNQQIINTSLSYAFNFALLDTAPKVYQALNDTKQHAYQQAQLAMLTDIDQQLRKLTHAIKN
ncbi:MULTISPECIES: hypothetical protein [Cysteiniphilum]|uniref:Uncharacterized protein n=1 Tax=Cysteiniphilum litorale TaxID=2056700 RepID=A0A8J2Z795_9GAMM|nr:MULTISPECIES: hypothetical protein [Cysteiniphilum]GGG08187.1 hypothetical protein GCM10010995_27170 [Cysteiniphilum litorale]